MKQPAPHPLNQCAVLQQSSKPGKQAILGEHRALLPNVTLSVNFEEAADRWNVKQSLKRWDYLVHGRRIARWVAFEVHQAKFSELAQKKADTQTILAKHCPDMLAAITAWHVCVKGDLPPSVRTRLADQGIRLSRSLIDSI